jgi:hypothetical protein
MMKRPSCIQSKFSNFTVCLLNTSPHINTYPTLPAWWKWSRFSTSTTTWVLLETYPWIHRRDCLKPILEYTKGTVWYPYDTLITLTSNNKKTYNRLRIEPQTVNSDIVPTLKCGDDTKHSMLKDSEHEITWTETVTHTNMRK